MMADEGLFVAFVSCDIIKLALSILFGRQLSSNISRLMYIFDTISYKSLYLHCHFCFLWVYAFINKYIKTTFESHYVNYHYRSLCQSVDFQSSSVYSNVLRDVAIGSNVNICTRRHITLSILGTFPDT